MTFLRNYLLEFLIVVFVGINIYLWILVGHSQSAAGALKVTFLNVGQGDSILIQGPTGQTMLVDGGPDRSVLRELPKELGYFDRDIDLVVETHPDKDHIAGLIDVLARYDVSYFMEPGIPGTTAVYESLMEGVKNEKGIHTFLARRGMRIHLGGGAYADVLYPDRDVSKLETNTGSIVLHVVYRNTSFMLTGDLPSTVEDYLVFLDGNDGNLTSTILKAGHHGSKTSTDALWLSAVQPDTVIISAGRGNSYGHPTKEVLDRVKNEGATVLSTIDLGTINLVSDGETVVHK